MQYNELGRGPGARAQSPSNTSLSRFSFSSTCVVLYSTKRSKGQATVTSVVLCALVLMHATSITERSCLNSLFFSGAASPSRK